MLDSFAILASYRKETGGVRVYELLTNRDHSHWMTYINVGEVYYRIAKESGLAVADEALVWLEDLPFQFIEANRALALAAAKIKAQYALSYADCFAAALAMRVDAAVVTGDPEFEQIKDIVEIEWLPAKPKNAPR